jgi:hypothetical protein
VSYFCNKLPKVNNRSLGEFGRKSGHPAPLSSSFKFISTTFLSQKAKSIPRAAIELMTLQSFSRKLFLLLQLLYQA